MPDDYRVAETINQDGDISGWIWSPISSDRPFVITGDACEQSYHPLPLGAGDGTRALASARGSGGALLICGYTTVSGNPLWDHKPVLWHFECGQATVLDVYDHYTEGMFTDVVWDDGNSRWIIVGSGAIQQSDGSLVTGATTFTVEYDPAVGPASFALQAYGPVANPEEQAVTTVCGDISSDCDIAVVAGSTDRAWSITATNTEGEYHVGGHSFVSGLDGNQGCLTNRLGTSDTFQTQTSPQDLLMPVQETFLIKPTNWVCSEDGEEIPICSRDGKPGSIMRLMAFDVLADRLACGVMLTEFVDPINQWLPFYGTDVANELEMFGSIEASALRGTILDSSGKRHLVGFEQLSSVFGETVRNVTRTIGNTGTLDANAHQAVEWVEEGGALRIRNLNETRAGQIGDDVVLISASDINRNGSIIGLAKDSTSIFGYLLTDTELINLDAVEAGTAGCPCPSDLNGDGITDGGDLGLFLTYWGSADECSPGNLDGQGPVNGADLGVLLTGWGACND
jgi:hypothetical protein